MTRNGYTLDIEIDGEGSVIASLEREEYLTKKK